VRVFACGRESSYQLTARTMSHEQLLAVIRCRKRIQKGMSTARGRDQRRGGEAGEDVGEVLVYGG
jgi:hypothetical protein